MLNTTNILQPNWIFKKRNKNQTQKLWNQECLAKHISIATGGKYLSIITVNWLIRKCLKYTNQHLKDVTCHGPPKFLSKQISPQKCQLAIKFTLPKLSTSYQIHSSQILNFLYKFTPPKLSTCYQIHSTQMLNFLSNSLYPNSQLAIKFTLPKFSTCQSSSLWKLICIDKIFGTNTTRVTSLSIKSTHIPQPNSHFKNLSISA